MKNFSLKNAKILGICLGIYYLLSSLGLGFIWIIQKIVFQNVPELSKIKEASSIFPVILDILNVYLPLMMILGLCYTFLGIFIAKIKYKFYSCLLLIATSLIMLGFLYFKLNTIVTLLQSEITGLGDFQFGFENFIVPIITFIAPQVVLSWGLWIIEHRTEEDPLMVP